LKLTARRNPQLDNDYIDIQYRELTPAINKIFEICNESGTVLLCEKDDSTHKVDVNDVLYIEWVDNRSCIYTRDDVYTVASSLTQLEESLNNKHFIRISKMALVNIYKIRSVSNGLNFRLNAEMMNGEKITINRHYRGALLNAIDELANNKESK